MSSHPSIYASPVEHPATPITPPAFKRTVAPPIAKKQRFSRSVEPGSHARRAIDFDEEVIGIIKRNEEILNGVHQWLQENHALDVDIGTIEKVLLGYIEVRNEN